jgi:hypothetical protein
MAQEDKKKIKKRKEKRRKDVAGIFQGKANTASLYLFPTFKGSFWEK